MTSGGSRAGSTSGGTGCAVAAPIASPWSEPRRASVPALIALLALAACGGAEESSPREVTDLERARDVCAMLAGTAVDCDYNRFARRIQAVVLAPPAQIQALCESTAGQMAQRTSFDEPRELHLSTPDSLRPVATCALD